MRDPCLQEFQTASITNHVLFFAAIEILGRSAFKKALQNRLCRYLVKHGFLFSAKYLGFRKQAFRV